MPVEEQADFRDAVESAWSTVLGLDVEPGQPINLMRGEADHVTGCVQITGAWHGAVMVDCSIALARQITAIMFGIEVYELMPDQISDALGEMTNIIGGTIKSFLPEPSCLSLPAVAEGMDCYFRVIGSRLVAQHCYSLQGEPFQVTVVERLK